MNQAQITSLLCDVEYPGYTFTVTDNGRMYLQATFNAVCSKLGEPFVQYTRKWYISNEATRSEIVQTAFKCVLTSLEHEARESFKYRERSVFGPHIDVDALWSVCTQEDERPLELMSDKPPIRSELDRRMEQDERMASLNNWVMR